MDGVLIAADTRITYPNPDADTHIDNAIKVFPFAPGTAIGYVGDVLTAAIVIQHLIAGRDRRRRIDPISLLSWLPRCARAVHQRLPPEMQKTDLAFMVASSLANRPMVVEKARVAEILFDAVRNGMHSAARFRSTF